MKHVPFLGQKPMEMTIFNSYVKLLEGTCIHKYIHGYQFYMVLPCLIYCNFMHGRMECTGWNKRFGVRICDIYTYAYSYDYS